MRIDFTNVSMEMFTLLEPGEYVLRVTNAEEKTSAKGNPMIEVNFEEEQTGAKLRDYFVITEKNLPKLKNFLADIGHAYEGMVEVLPFHWAGERVKAKIGVETYTKQDGTEGKRNKISYYSPVVNQVPQTTATTPNVAAADDDIPF